MTAASPVAPLFEALEALENWLCSEDVRHAFIGGLAVALLGRPRTTRDIDGIVLLGTKSIDDLLKTAESAGFPPRVPDALAFARESRVLLLRHQATGVPIDLSLGLLSFEEAAVQNARLLDVKGLQIPVATVEDLLVLKAIAGRPRDIVDIEGLLALNPDVDRARVRTATAAFSEILEEPGILETLDRLMQPVEEEPARRKASPPKGKRR